MIRVGLTRELRSPSSRSSCLHIEIQVCICFSTFLSFTMLEKKILQRLQRTWQKNLLLGGGVGFLVGVGVVGVGTK